MMRFINPGFICSNSSSFKQIRDFSAARQLPNRLGCLQDQCSSGASKSTGKVQQIALIYKLSTARQPLKWFPERFQSAAAASIKRPYELLVGQCGPTSAQSLP